MRLFLPSITVAQVTAPSPAGVAEAERVIVTGSNIAHWRRLREKNVKPVKYARAVATTLCAVRDADLGHANAPQGVATTLVER